MLCKAEPCGDAGSDFESSVASWALCCALPDRHSRVPCRVNFHPWATLLSILEMYSPSAPYSAGGSCRVTQVWFTLPVWLLALNSSFFNAGVFSNFNVLSGFKIAKLYWHICCGTGRSDGSYQLSLIALAKALIQQDRAWQICSELIFAVW